MSFRNPFVPPERSDPSQTQPCEIWMIFMKDKIDKKLATSAIQRTLPWRISAFLHQELQISGFLDIVVREDSSICQRSPPDVCSVDWHITVVIRKGSAICHHTSSPYDKYLHPSTKSWIFLGVVIREDSSICQRSLPGVCGLDWHVTVVIRKGSAIRHHTSSSFDKYLHPSTKIWIFLDVIIRKGLALHHRTSILGVVVTGPGIWGPTRKEAICRRLVQTDECRKVSRIA